MDALVAVCAGLGGFGFTWFLTGDARSVSWAPPRLTASRMAWGKGFDLGLGARREERERKKSATRDMPAFLDIVTLGITAGLSFDASLELYCDRYDTPLARMMSDAILSWRMGVRGRGDALEELAREVGSPAMVRFSTAVSDALAFGTPLAEALERQAQLIRDEQRSQVEEEIERVPVKMLIPLGTLIVPAMLVSILGPLLGPALSMA